MNETRSTREECAQPAFTNGLKPSAFRADNGRRIPVGTSNDQISTYSHARSPRTGHFGTVSELKPSHTLHEHRR